MNQNSNNGEFEGVWWLPEKPGEKLPGVLRTGSDSASKLKVSGAFDKTLEDQNKVFKVIHGLSFGGPKITLFISLEFDSYEHHEKEGIFSWTEYSTVDVLFGGYFTDPDEKIFSSAEIFIDGLAEWLDYRPLKMDTCIDPDKDFNIKFSPLKVSGFESQEINSSLSFKHSFSCSIERRENLNFDSKTYIEIKPSEHKSINWFYETIADTRNLFSLLMGFPAKTSEIALKKKDSKRRFKYINSITQEQLKDKSNINWFQMFTAYKEIQEDLGTIFDSWIRKKEQLRLCYYYFFAHFFKRNKGPIEPQFLFLAQALEQFDRNTNNSSRYIETNDFRELRTHLFDLFPDHIDKGLLESIKSKVDYANQLTFPSRIDRLLSKVDKVFLEKFIPSPADYQNKMAKTRNGLVHGFNSSEDEKECLKVENIGDLMEQTNILLTKLLLDEIGTSKDVTTKRLVKWHNLSTHHSFK